jgi:hypothetical protein
MIGMPVARATDFCPPPRGGAAWLASAAVALLVSGCGQRLSNDPAPDLKLAASIRSGAAASGAAAAASTGTGWGTLKGVFKYGGDPPAVGFMSTGGKDAETCGAQVPVETLIVDKATKGLANVLVFARKVSRVKPEATSPTGDKPEFDQKKCLFLSRILAVQTKYPVELKNSDPVAHNTAGSPAGNAPFNMLLPPGQSAQYKFTRALAVPTEVSCSIHAWMKAYMICRDDPYFAVSGKDGSFEIANLPAGEEIEFQVWHERAAGLSAGKVVKGRFKLKIPENGVEDLKVIEVPASEF